MRYRTLGPAVCLVLLAGALPCFGQNRSEPELREQDTPRRPATVRDQKPAPVRLHRPEPDLRLIRVDVEIHIEAAEGNSEKHDHFSLTTVPGNNAMIQFGQEEAIVTGSMVTPQGRSRSSKFEQTGSMVQVTPKIVGDKIVLALKLEKSWLELRPENSDSADLPPTTSLLIVDTTLPVSPGRPQELHAMVSGSGGMQREAHIVINCRIDGPDAGPESERRRPEAPRESRRPPGPPRDADPRERENQPGPPRMRVPDRRDSVPGDLRTGPPERMDRAVIDRVRLQATAIAGNIMGKLDTNGDNRIDQAEFSSDIAEAMRPLLQTFGIDTHPAEEGLTRDELADVILKGIRSRIGGRPQD